MGTGLTWNSDSEESIEVVGNGKELIESIERIDVYDAVEMQDLSYSTVAVDVQDLQDFPTRL